MRAAPARSRPHARLFTLFVAVIAVLTLVLLWARSSAAAPDPLRSVAGHFALDVVAAQTEANVLVVPPFRVDGARGTDLGRYLALELAETLRWRAQYVEVYGPDVRAFFAPDAFVTGYVIRAGCTATVGVSLREPEGISAPVGPARVLELGEIPLRLWPLEWRESGCSHRSARRVARPGVDWADVSFGPFIGVGASALPALVGGAESFAPTEYDRPWERTELLRDHFDGTAPAPSTLRPDHPMPRFEAGFEVTVGAVRGAFSFTIAGGSLVDGHVDLGPGEGSWTASLGSVGSLTTEVGPAFPIPAVDGRVRPFVAGRFGFGWQSYRGVVDEPPVVVGDLALTAEFNKCRNTVCDWDWVALAPVGGFTFGVDLRSPTRTPMSNGLILRPIGYLLAGPRSMELGVGLTLGFTGVPLWIDSPW